MDAGTGNVERWIKVTKEALVVMGGLALLLYFLPVLTAVRTRLTQIEALSIGPVSVKLRADIATFAPDNLPVQAVGGHPMMIQKGSLAELSNVRSRLQQSKGARIDVMLLAPGQTYNAQLLREYVNQLNIRFVVFQGQNMDGWMDAGGFVAQLNPNRDYVYQELLATLIGVSQEVVRGDAAARTVLARMEALRFDNLAVIDAERRFQFVVSREDILSKLVTSVLLASTPE